MKNSLKSIFFVLFLSALFVSCEKDDETNETTKTNFLKVGEAEYVLANGVLINYGTTYDEGVGSDWHHEGDNVDLTLISSGLKVPDSLDDETTGSGQYIYFEMFTSNGSSLDEGEYVFDNESPFPVNSFSSAEYSINWDEDNETGDIIELISGKVAITKSGNDYEITIDCTDVSGKKVTAHFKNTLTYFDDSQEDDKSAKVSFGKKK